MGQADIATAKYLRRNEIFADMFNFFLYNGKEVIDPDSLQELDTREIEVPYGGEEDTRQPVLRTRDVIKSVVAMTDERMAYLILGVENQTHIHYAMPVRNMLYDALQYTKQVEEATASHKKAGDYKDASSDEFLSGFLKTDHLLPVVTLVVYWGAEQWDGPRSIHEMFESKDETSLSFIPDYWINLIEPAAITDDEFENFHTTLKEIMEFIKYSTDPDRLLEMVDADDAFQHLGRTEMGVLRACVNKNLPEKQNKEEEETTNMKDAITILEERAEEKGKTEGKAETALQNIKSLMKTMGLSAEQAMDALEISGSDREAVKPLL